MLSASCSESSKAAREGNGLERLNGQAAEDLQDTVRGVVWGVSFCGVSPGMMDCGSTAFPNLDQGRVSQWTDD